MNNINNFVISSLDLLSEENQKKYWGVPTKELISLFKTENKINSNVQDQRIQDKLIHSISTQFNCNSKRILGNYKKGTKRIKYFRIQLKSNVDSIYLAKESSPTSRLGKESTCAVTESEISIEEVITDTSSIGKESTSVVTESEISIDHTEDDSNSFEETFEIVQTNENNLSLKTIQLPALHSVEMMEYAKQHLQHMPERLKCLFNFQSTRSISKALDLHNREPIFITPEVQAKLNDEGFVIIRNVIDQNLLQEVLRYINLKQHSECIDASAYLHLCGPRHTVGLVTKHGWTKFDYNGPVQQLITAVPNLYVCACELLGTTRLCTNFYEYKYNYPRENDTSNTKFEFLHTDGNYQQLLFADQAGLNIDSSFYQFIVPLTSMHPEKATVYFAKGFHKVWRDLTYRALQKGHWSRFGWRTCNPMKQFLPQDAKEFIEKKMTPAFAEPGDVIIFHALLPHGPNVNASNALRVAAYPFYAPLMENKAENELQSFLPNSVLSLKQNVSFGTCPKFAAHPWCDYKLQFSSRNFYSVLPYRQLPRSLLADCLFGFEPWSTFEKTKEATILFQNQQNIREECIRKIQQPTEQALRTWNNTIEELLVIHEKHTIFDQNCLLCSRLQNASLAQWWHSSDAIKHQAKNCDCIRCLETFQNNWRLWNTKGGCNCMLCN
jgi:hypothetical protein